MKIKLLDKYCMTRKEVSYTYESINLEGTRVVKRAAENLLTLGERMMMTIMIMIMMIHTRINRGYETKSLWWLGFG